MTFHHDTGKGSRPREYSVTQEEFGKKFDAIDWGVKAAPVVAEDVETLHVSRLSSFGSGGIITMGSIDIEGCSVDWSVDAEGYVVGKMIKAGCGTSSDGQG